MHMAHPSVIETGRRLQSYLCIIENYSETHRCTAEATLKQFQNGCR